MMFPYSQHDIVMGFQLRSVHLVYAECHNVLTVTKSWSLVCDPDGKNTILCLNVAAISQQKLLSMSRKESPHCVVC